MSIKDNVLEKKYIENDNNLNQIALTNAKKSENSSSTDVFLNNTQNKENSIIKIFLIFVLFFIVLLILSFSIFAFINQNNKNITNGIFIKNINVSNLSKEEAKQTVQKIITESLPKEIKLKHNDFETSIPLSNLGIHFDVDSAVSIAYNIGKSGNIFENTFSSLNALLSNINIEPSFTIDEKQLKTTLNDISSKLPDTAIESSYYIESNKLIITKGKKGNVIDIQKMSNYIKNKIINLDCKNKILTIITKTKEPSKINIEKIHNEIYKEPKDAYFTTEPYAVYSHEDGLDFAISLEEAKSILQEAKDEYEIPLKVLTPNTTTNMLKAEAFPDLLSTFSTKYAASNKNRTTNLILAASKINGTVLMPGETFSYNKVVGERTIAAGYKEAPIYVDGKVVDGLGGGICQITSTLYNAVVLANLEIVERSNHQFVPSYVTASRDATVVYGLTDFKFKNNRKYPIKIVCSVSGGIANFQIFGLKTNNEYEVVISSYETGRTANAIYSEAYKILKQNGQEVSRALLSKDVYKRH